VFDRCCVEPPLSRSSVAFLTVEGFQIESLDPYFCCSMSSFGHRRHLTF
jgi:hypothetical protein